uniref:Uncharacterized protein n=2 Tax=Talaromyces marneffei TaxID=37727 RepID=A0A093VDT6_TALMA
MALLLSSLPQQSITSVPRAPSSLTLIGLSVLLLLMTRATAATASMGVNSLLMGFQMSASVVVDKIASAHLHQKASSTILGIAAPAITRTGDPKRPFGVDNNTFMANTNKTVDFTLPDCENQQTCLGIFENSYKKMLETIPQQSAQVQYIPQTPQQQSYNYRQYSGRFPYTPTSPSPLGFRNVNAQAAISPTMTERNNNLPEGIQDQENASLSPLNKLNSDNSISKPFSFSPAYNTITPPNRRSTYEERFRKSGGSSNAYSRIFGSPSSGGNTPNNSTSTSSKHRQLFLNRVKQNRDEARFGSRGESLMMMEYHSEQQSWDEQMRRRAETLSQQYHIEDGEILNEEYNNDYEDNKDMMLDPEQSALEEFIMEEEDIDLSLVENLPTDENHMRSPAKSVSIFGGDDGDYDDIFMELVD